MIRLKAALPAVETDSAYGPEPILVTLLPGCLLRLAEEPRQSGLVDVKVGGKRYTVLYADAQNGGVPAFDHMCCMEFRMI